MKKLLLLVLAAPLAGCAQRAEMASSVGQPAQGPFTLRYKLAEQNNNQYQLRIDGDTTTGITSNSTGSATPGATPGGPTPAPDRTVQAKFQTQMTIQQVASVSQEPAGQDSTGAGTTTPSGSTASPTTAPSASERSGTDLGGGTTSMNEDRAPGNERVGDTTMPSGMTAGTSTPESASETTDLFELRQQVTNWTAQVNLPEGQIPNRFNGTFQNGKLTIQAQGAQIDLPQRYQQQIQQTLNRPVIATVTSKGEILNVEWPVPEQASTTAPGMKTESTSDGLRAMTGSTEALNLWFGVIRLPDQAVNVGQTWDAKDRFPVRASTTGPEFHMLREAKYTLTNVAQTPDGPVAEIAVNETLKLVRGGMTPADTSATTGADSSVATDSATSAGVTPADDSTKPDLLETRMGKVYFNIDRGVVDRAEEQVSVTWDTSAGTVASNSTTGSAASGSAVMTQGQLQGTVHLDRINTTGTTDNLANAPASNAPLNGPANAPSGTVPSANVPGSEPARSGALTPNP